MGRTAAEIGSLTRPGRRTAAPIPIASSRAVPTGRPEVMCRSGARQARTVAEVGGVLECVADVPTMEEAGMWVSIEFCVV